MSQQKRVLFVCTGNSARSQIAEALLRHIEPANRRAALVTLGVAA